MFILHRSQNIMCMISQYHLRVNALYTLKYSTNEEQLCMQETRTGQEHLSDIICHMDDAEKSNLFEKSVWQITR